MKQSAYDLSFRLYHCNPWSDTTQGVCPAFELYRSQPVPFFMSRFTGLTQPVAEFLASRVFCLLEDPHDDSPRITAGEFGRWVRDLPTMLGTSERPGHTRNLSMSSTVGYGLASVPASRRPSLRAQQHRVGDGRTSWVMGTSSRVPSVRTSWALSRNPSFGVGPVSDLLPETLLEASELPPVIDQEVEVEAEVQAEPEVDADVLEALEETGSRTGSTHKRRKRGARKGKGAASSSSLVGSPTTPTVDDTLNTLAAASQALAREISRTSKGGPTLQLLDAAGQPQSPSVLLSSSSSPAAQASPHSLPLISSSVSPTSPAPAPPAAAAVATPAPITKKPSKWKLGFGRASHSSQSDRSAAAAAAPPPPPVPAKAVPPPPPIQEVHSGRASLASLHGSAASSTGSQPQQKQPSAVAHNVTNLLMGLNANSAQPHASAKAHAPAPAPPPPVDDQTWGRGRRPRATGGPLYSGTNASSTWGPASTSSAFGATGPYAHNNGSNPNWGSPGNACFYLCFSFRW